MYTVNFWSKWSDGELISLTNHACLSTLQFGSYLCEGHDTYVHVSPVIKIWQILSKVIKWCLTYWKQCINLHVAKVSEISFDPKVERNQFQIYLKPKGNTLILCWSVQYITFSQWCVLNWICIWTNTLYSWLCRYSEMQSNCPRTA